MSRPVALLLVIAIVLTVPAALLSWYLSNGLQRDLRARGASVRVFAGPLGVFTGRIWRLQFFVRGAAFEGGTVREIRGDLRGVRLHLPRAAGGHLTVRAISAGSAVVILDETDVQRALANARDIQGARVRLDDGTARITGTVLVVNSSFPVEVTARLAIDDGRALLLRVETLNISGIAIPRGLSNALMTAVNPLLLAPQAPVPLRFTGLEVDDGRAVIRGVPAP